MRIRLIVCTIQVIAGALGTAQADGLRYRVQRLGTLPGGDPGNTPEDLNNVGQVCGRDNVIANAYDAFRWDSENGEIIDLGTLPGCGDLGALAWGMNDLGHVTGTDTSDDDCFYGEAWLWSSESGMIGLGAIPGGLYPSSGGLAINNLDQVVGGAWGTSFAEAMLWDPVAGMIGLGEMGGDPPSSVAHDINDSTWVVGSASSPRGSEAFLWTPQDGMIGLGDFYDDGYADSGAFGINELGHVVGVAAHPDTVQQSFIWTQESGLTGLGVLDPNAQYQSNGAVDISDRDEVVGLSVWGTTGDLRSFIWDPVRGMRNISDLIDPCETRRRPFGYCLVKAINNSGQILLDMDADRYGILLTPYLLGDLDENAAVTLADLGGLLTNFGRAGDAEYQHGDLDCDQDVDLQDLAILLSNFGETLP